MTVPAWPESLNTWAIRNSWSISQLDNPPLVSEMNAGNTRQRRKFTMRISMITFQMVFTSAELPDFRTFYDVTLSSGASKFTMPVWDGTAYVSRSMKFRTPPKFSEFAFERTLVTFDVAVESL